MSPITMAERAEMRAMARELARRELEPRAAALDAGGQDVLSECWGRLVEAGLDRALLSEQNGGVELDVLDLLATIEELAVGDGGVAMCVLLCNAALATLADEQLAEVPWGARWALVPAAPEVELTMSGGALDGRLACALGAHGAHGLVFLLDGPAPMTWTVDAGAAGLRLERDPAQMGLRAAPAASVELTGAACLPCALWVCPSGCARGADGSDGSKEAMSAASALALLRAGTAAIAHGIARRAYEMALEYAHARQQGGVAIIEHDAVSDMLSAMAVRLACWPQIAVDHGPEIDQAQALAVKIAATDAAVASTTDAVQVFGGTGYMVETGIEKLMRDAKYCQMFPEPNWVAHDELMRPERSGAAVAILVGSTDKG
jgi:alkylation response protein AidB-like acyl-CoA dehydrogenase